MCYLLEGNYDSERKHKWRKDFNNVEIDSGCILNKRLLFVTAFPFLAIYK